MNDWGAVIILSLFCVVAIPVIFGCFVIREILKIFRKIYKED